MGYASDTVVIKSPNDRRLYRIIHLPNGLTALLIHDPEIFPDGTPDVLGEKGKEGSEDDEEEEEGSEDEEEEEEEEEEEGIDDEDDRRTEDEDEDEDEDDEDDVEQEGGAKRKSKVDFPTKKAAAAVCVGIGSFADPAEAQGLAHFLEHMLFMGSSEFPDENEYDSYLSKHGGSSNAYTETEYTCYHFEVNREYLKGSLQRFSQFFVSPLVKSEAMEREVLAVDSGMVTLLIFRQPFTCIMMQFFFFHNINFFQKEFNQVLQSDSCRLLQLQCHTSLPDHPFNRFFWGNKKSLSDAIGRGVNLREEILQLYRKNYDGGKMKLVVIGGETLDTLETWVVDLFGNVKKGENMELFHNAEAVGQKGMPIWKPGKLYRTEAVKDVHVLDLSWTLPCLRKEYLKKPEDYLSHLLGHECRGSLLFFLKAKGWASSLSAGVGDEGTRRSSFAYVFTMSIYLTDSGMEMIHEVICTVYQYIKLLRESAPQEWIFKELQDIGNMEFRFAEEQPQDEYASDLAENLLFYSEEHIIYGEYAFEVWDSELIEQILGYLSPDNMRIDLLSKSFDKELPAVEVEPWFGTRYIEEDISGSLLELWRNPPCVDPSLHLPAKNDFIPKDFSLRSACVSKNVEGTDQPKCILNEPAAKIWYKLDTKFNVPRANTYLLISVKKGYTSLRDCVLMELSVTLLKDELNDIIYQARVAKLDTSLSINGDKIVLKVYGFNDKLSVLLSNILSQSRYFLPKTDRFMVIKEDMERSLRNYNMKPLNHSSYLRLQLLRETFWDVDDKLACLSCTSLTDVEAFIPELLSQLYIEGLCHGNLKEDEALSISNSFGTILPAEPLPLEVRHQERVLCLPSGTTLIRSVPVKNEFEVNSVVELYFQIEQDTGTEATWLRAITDLFCSIIEEPCFNQLRTKEQLGYVVECDPRMTYRVLGFCFRVQSSKYSPLHLHERIISFINGLQEFMDGLDDETFNNHVSGLIEEKLEKDPCLSDETDRYWNQIVDGRYLFDMPKMEAEALKTIKKSDVIGWYKTYLREPSPKCRKLAIHVWGCNTNMKEESTTQSKFGKVMEDISSLKLSSDFYPSLC